MESRLIARADPIIRVYHRGGPTGQRAYSGNVITMPKKLHTFVTKLPRAPKDCHFYIIRKNVDTDNYKDFIVRRKVIKQWLDYLIKNNDVYRAIELDTETLEHLPENGVPNDLQTLVDDTLIDKINELIRVKTPAKPKNTTNSNISSDSINSFVYFFSFTFT